MKTIVVLVISFKSQLAFAFGANYLETILFTYLVKLGF